MAERIAMLDPDQAIAAARAHGIRESMAKVNAYRILLRHPELAKAVNHLLTMLLFSGNKLDRRLRELAIMRIGWATGSEYEWTQHWRFATNIGIPAEHVVAVRDWRTAACFDAADRAVLAAVDDTLEGGKISAPVWTECARHLGPDELLELVVAIGNWSMFSQLLRSLEVPLEEGVAGWPPDGERPTHT
jgi:alkylhydroperoxidase family enzyme